MNTEEPYRDQAERLRRRIEQINEQVVEEKDTLPPREEIHRQKKKKTKFKLKYPVIRLLVLLFILLPIIIFSVISYMDGRNITGSMKSSGDSKGYEPINLENSKSGKESQKDVNKNDKTEQIPTEETKENSTVEKQEPENQDNQTNVDSGKSTDHQAEQTDTSTKTETSSEPVNDSKNGKTIFHTVQPQETLFRIAMKYYNSPEGMVIIQKENHLPSDQIEAGQVLKIKIDQ